MDKLKIVIKEYGRWSEFLVYIERIEIHIENDFSISLENAKALLEAVGKEICKSNSVELEGSPSINKVLKEAFSSMGYANSSLVNQVSSALATIGQQVGELRNEIGSTLHGKPLEEIKQRNSKIDLLTKYFLIDTVELISIFLIRNFHTKHQPTTHKILVDSLGYQEAEEFNESWDDTFSEFVMGDYSYPASEILFNVDKQAYISEYKTFTEGEE